MALIITGAENLAKGLTKALRGSLDLTSGIGGVLEATAGLASKGVEQVQKILAGGSSPGKSPRRECTSLTMKKRHCKNYALKGKKKCCVHAAKRK